MIATVDILQVRVGKRAGKRLPPTHRAKALEPGPDDRKRHGGMAGDASRPAGECSRAGCRFGATPGRAAPHPFTFLPRPGMGSTNNLA